MKRLPLMLAAALVFVGCDREEATEASESSEKSEPDDGSAEQRAEAQGKRGHGKRGHEGKRGHGKRGHEGKRGHGKRGHEGKRGHGKRGHDGPPPPRKPNLEDRVLADSGLGVGGRLSPFQILNSDSGDEYCQVCRYGSSPKLMVVGTADDEAFHKDLLAIRDVVNKHGADQVKAFAVITEIEDGKAVTPSDPEAAKARAKALKAELGIEFPVVIPAPEGGGANEIWETYYNITKSRTVMLSDGRNEVKYSAIEPSDFAGLQTAIEEVVGS